MKIKRLGRIQWSIRLISLTALLSGLLLSILPVPIVRAASPHYVKSTATGTGDCSSWANACTLQTALTTAVSGDEIWVAAGTYTPTATTDRTATFQLKGGVAIYGGFAMTETLRSQRDWTAHVVTLSGDLLGDDGPNFANTAENSYHVVTGASGATLDGVTVSSGNANGSSPDSRGGGMLNFSSSPTLTNVIFHGNLAGGDGGGMLNVDNSSPTLTNVTFYGNSADYGGGIENWNNSNPTLTNVAFSGNSASYGGGMMNFSNSNPTLTNVTFSGNSAIQGGGGLANWFNSSPLLTNVTFSGNSAVSGGALYDLDISSIPQVRNSLLWGDSGGEINDSSTLTITNSVVQGGCPTGGMCTHIITDDPLLDLLGNYGGGTLTLPLLPGSAAIDGTSADCPSTDQRGVARGTTCDIGAFESQGFTLTKTGGDNQSAVTNTAFPHPLSVAVTSTYSEPVNGGRAILTAPTSGASIMTTPLTLTIAGGAVSQSVTANDTLGAYNVIASCEGATSVSFTLTNSCVNTVTNDDDSGPGSLRQAIADLCLGGTITFDSDYTIGLETGQLVIDKDMTIDGTGHAVTIDGLARSRIFYVSPGVIFNLQHVTVTNGRIDDGGPYSRSSARPEDVNTDGGGLYLDGAIVTLQDVQITNNVASGYGGGIYNKGGLLNINPTTIISNTAGLNGGGLYNAGGTLILTDTVFINNTANGSWPNGNGGGLYSVYGEVTLSQTQFLTNTAYQNGGGAYLTLFDQGGGGIGRPDKIAADPGTTMIDGSTFQGNIASGVDGGGLYNADGTLIITDTIFSYNTANGNNYNGNGGGLYSVYGEVILSQTEFLTNTAYQNGGGAYLTLFDQGGSGIGRPDQITAGSGTAEIDHSLFQGNTTDYGDGGGLYNGLGETTIITAGAFLENRAECGGNCYGGGIYNAGALNLDGLTIVGNSVRGGEGYGFGGGFYGGEGSTLTMTNSTVSNNTATNAIDGYGLGGGLALDSEATVVNTTVSRNTAADGGGIYYASSFALNNVTIAGNTGGGVYDGTEGTVSFDAQNTIIGDNTDVAGDAWDCAGTLNSLGYNLIETIADCTINGDLTGVLTEIDPEAGPLQNNGGATRTMALGASSPALEAGNPATPGSGVFACAATDQRGVIRPQGTTCDMGAYEGQGALSKSVDVVIAQAGQRANYTLVTSAVAPITNGMISDTLPTGLTLAGPIALEPAGAGTIGTPPTIVTDLNLSSGQWLTITIPVTVNVGVANGTLVTNTAILTGEGLLPLEASATFLVDTFDLASSVKLVNTAATIAGDVLTYTIQLTNTSLHKDSAFTLTDVIPTGAVYVPGSLTATLGSAGYAGGIITWTGGISGTANVAADYLYGDSLGGGSLSGVTYNWIEISSTGTSLGLHGADDDQRYPIALPFQVHFYGTDYTDLAVATNGTVSFQGTYLGYDNQPIPAPNGENVNTFIAPLWTDLYITPGEIYYEVQGTAPHRRVVIEYHQVSHCCTSPDSGSWEIILYEDQPDILMQYQDVNFGDAAYDYGATATVGIQNSIDQGVEYSYNSPVLTDSLAIMFAPLPASGFAADLTFAVTTTAPVPDGTWITNTAIVSDSYSDAWSLSAATLLSNPADLSIVKQAPASISGLAPLTYTLSITNSGPLAAAFVTVTDDLPAGVTFIGASGAGWSCSQLGGTVTCAQDSLGVGAASDIVIDVTAPNISGTLINTALVASTADDEGQLNNTATATTTVTLNTRSLITSTTGTGSGTIDLTPPGGTYLYGIVVTATATANVGSTFTGWSGACTGTGVCLVTMDDDKSITATFSLNMYTLTVATIGNGSVTPATSVYPYGTVVPITATAGVGSAFTGWSGDLSGSTNPTSILIDGDKSITATFSLNTYTLTVATVGNGSVAPTTNSYPYGTVVPVTATAGVGSSFSGWSGDLSGSTNPTSILIDGDKSITATFALNTYTLTVATVGNGSVTPTTSTYAYGTLVPVTATAGVGSSFSAWSGDLTGSVNPTLILIDSDKSITATFTVVIDHYSVFLPLIMKNYLRLPDLIVQSVAASSDVITVVIKNIGDGPAEQAFWVDVYINPTPPPAAVNEIWWDLDRSREGVAWGVIDPIVPIQPGEVYTLTSHGDFVSPDRTFFPGNLPVGTPIYAQVDSYNAATTYGAVLETHEYYQRPYNNILGPIYSTAGQAGPLSRAQPIGPELNPQLPERSARP